ncbi:MAG TPA: hypothetical protein VGR71_10440 [Nitrospira sp.]|nr:hypothetical protein [Nitrospira sp.]
MKTLRRLPKHPCELRCTSPREVNGKDAFFTGSVEFDQDSLKAAKDGEVKIPTFKMRAYTGKPMRVRGFYDPVIVNLKGAKFAKRVTPIIMDHDVSARIGHSNSQEVDVEGNEIVVQGQASSSSDYASSFVADAKAGIPFESSIGATILDSTYVPEGKSVTVNGKEWQGPLLVANKVKIREVSAVLLGADGDTETRVVASKRKPMNEFEKFVEGLGFNASELTDDQRTKLQATFDKLSTDPPKPAGKGKKKGKVAAAAVVTAEDDDDEEVTVEATYEQALDKHRENLEAEETRIDSIRSLADEYGEKVNNEHEFTIRAGKAEGKKFKGLKNFKAAAIRYGMDVNQFELACLRASRSEGTNVAGQINHNGNLESEVCEAAVARELAGSFGMPSGRERWVAGCGGNPRKFGDIPNNMQGRE